MTAQGRLPRILGIDDPVHYAANVQAYRDAVPLLSQERQRINENQQTLAHEKARVCSADLKAFDDAVVAFEDEKISLGDYVLEMSNRARSVPEQVKRFTQALKMERALDFRQVEKERAALIGVLAERLNRDETGALLAQSAAYRAGKMGYGVFYDHLQNLCQSKEVPLARFPAMDAYVRYVLLADGIDAEQLFKELVRLEKSIYAALAVTSKEKDWVARSREGRLLKKLVNFSMTPADWKEYEPLAGRPEMAPFEAFYKEAHIRDGAMADNLLKALETGQGTTAILVTGGYHAEGIADRLTAQGVTVLSYVPKIEKIDTTQGSAYLSVFSQEKTPLEKLFAGEKLFLGHNPAGGVNEAALLTETLQRVGIPSDAVRSKIEGYLTQHYQGHRLTFGEHFRRTDGLWVAPVHLFDGKQTITFSVVYRLEGNKITIQSFGLAEREDRSPFGAFVGKIIWAHNKLAPVAVWVSLVTVFLLFVFIPSWTPDPFWNGLGLFALAANTSVVDAGSIDGQRRIHPANPAHPDYKELKMLGPDREKAAENGGLITNIKILVLKKGKRKGKRVNLYLLLEKKEKKLANQQEGPPALKLDIPGGGAAGKTEGISLPKGGQREFREEVGLKNVNIARFRDLGLAKRNEYRFYSIPGPKANFTNRRPTIFRRVNLTNKEANGLQTSTEHEGHLWLTLPEALDRFDDLNTASKMAFYLEFLRLAYGITRVRSLRVLTETRRLKSMTDPVLIETDGGSFIWSPNGEVNLHKPEGFSVEGRMDRVASNKSVLDEWENPRVFREMGGETLPIPLVMWRLKNESRSIQLLKFLFHDGVAATTGDRSSAQINFLASRVPPGEVALSSFRFLVMREEKYVFLVRNGRKNECVGGVGINPEERLSYVENQLRVPKGSIGSTSLSAGLKSFIIHKIGNGVRFNYVEVEDGTIHLELKSPIEDKGIIELDYDQLKQQYYDFSLSARMLIMKEIVKREYGYHVSSIRPIRSSQEGGVSQIILTTDKGPFVFRPANTVIDDKKNAVRVRVKPDGSNGLYVNIGGLNFILTQRKSRSSHYEIVRRQLQERQAAVQRGDWIPLFRKIALGIKSSPEIWSELLNAQKQIVAEQGNAGIVRKPDHSLVTEWDFKLQLAFKDMIQQSGLPAQVRGEGRTLNPDFLKRLPGQDQDRVIDLVLNNAADMPEGLVFYVVPLDGTKNFTEGGKEFAFTFGVLYDGDPLYAATYLPAQDDLYEAVVKERALYKNGEQVMSRKARVFFRSKNQQDLHPHLKKMIQVVRRARNKHLAASSEGTGQATSLWMTKLFELVGAGVDRFVSPQKKGRQEEKSYEVRFGIHYKRNAPRYELGLAVGAMVINLLWVNSVWMGVGSAVLFIVSHHKFKFLDLKTDVKPSPFKVIVMALIYGTLIAISPGVVQGLVHGMGAEVVVDFLMVFVGWHAAYGLHRYFDPPWRAAINVDDTLGIKPLSLAYWTSRYFGLSETYARLLGGLEMLVQISLLVWLRLGIESVVPNGSGLFALMGFDPIFGPLFFMGLLYLFWANYMLMSVVANREGYDPPQIKNLVGPLAVFLFLVPTPLGLGFGAFFYLAYYWNHLVDQSTGPKRILSADEKTKKGRTIKLLSSLPDGINSTGENVMSVRVIIKIIVGGLFGFSERYLLVQNREGRWELPGGGGEQNENVAIAAIREIHQELGRQFALAFVRLMRGGAG
jgi:3'-phosphoadenosine 5'-phosphosulfate (PAPS) 3'-phosphatase/8-oxo-dGTP pyrophosphatase MutT (NUDIX family)